MSTMAIITSMNITQRRKAPSNTPNR
jgi:hypothetical protein